MRRGIISNPEDLSDICPVLYGHLWCDLRGVRPIDISGIGVHAIVGPNYAFQFAPNFPYKKWQQAWSEKRRRVLDRIYQEPVGLQRKAIDKLAQMHGQALQKAMMRYISKLSQMGYTHGYRVKYDNDDAFANEIMHHESVIMVEK